MYKNIFNLFILCIFCSSFFGLFSASFNKTAIILGLNKDIPLSLFNTKLYEITAIETVSFCDQLFMFTGTKNHSVICWSCTLKKLIFEINLSENVVPIKIACKSVIDKEKGEYIKLLILSESQDSPLQNIFKSIQIQYFVFD